jgi:hypothetical protein
MHGYAAARGGRCVAAVYVNAKTPLEWECAAGHRWRATPNRVQQGNWCPKCAGTARLDIETMHALAAARGGRCLSSEYVNKSTHLEWECAVGHRWRAIPGSVRLGKWCRRCGGKTAKAGASAASWERARRAAEARGGRCLSTVYLDTHSHLEWECSEGHRWSAVPSGILRGAWCPTCSGSLSERMVRTALEQLFGVPFPKTRPAWLRPSPGARRRELDGYAAPLRLAFEYQGAQHYRLIGSMTRTASDLRRVQEGDAWKRSACAAAGVLLVEVPEFATVDAAGRVREVRAAVEAAFLAAGRPLPAGWSTRAVDLAPAYLTGPLAELRALAEARGGRLISTAYADNRSHLEWECCAGHRWGARPGNVRQGRWCPVCARVRNARRRAAGRAAKAGRAA